MTLKHQKAPQKKITKTVTRPVKPAGEGKGMSRIGNLGAYAHKPKGKRAGY